jgi:hypothetical protein
MNTKMAWATHDFKTRCTNGELTPIKLEPGCMVTKTEALQIYWHKFTRILIAW